MWAGQLCGGVAVDTTFDSVRILSWKSWGSHSGPGKAGQGRAGQDSHRFWVCGKTSFPQHGGERERGAACQYDQHWLLSDAGQDGDVSSLAATLSHRLSSQGIRCNPNVTSDVTTPLHPLRNIAIPETQAGPKGYSRIGTKKSSRRNSAPAL